MTPEIMKLQLISLGEEWVELGLVENLDTFKRICLWSVMRQIETVLTCYARRIWLTSSASRSTDPFHFVR